MAMMERPFDEEMRALKQKLLEMAVRAEEQIALAVRGLKDRDESLACQVLGREEAINLLDIEIDEMGLRLLALRQPLAADLRFITSAMKISGDVERIGDLAVNIAERTIDLLKSPELKPLIDIPLMALMAQEMVRDALNAFVNADDKLARDVCERDDKVDQLNDQVFRELLTYMMQDPGTTSRAVDLILVGRHIERIADHATNISEDVIYMVKGTTIKHHIEEGRASGLTARLGDSVKSCGSGIDEDMEGQDRDGRGGRESDRQKPGESQEGLIAAHDPSETPGRKRDGDDQDDGG